jgi:flagellum-specific ATP synthase
MGAYIAGSDPVLDEAIARRESMLAFLRQSPVDRIAFETSRNALVAEFGQ